MAFISLETFDKTTRETRIVGYSAINFFLNRKSKEQPNKETDNDIIL